MRSSHLGQPEWAVRGVRDTLEFAQWLKASAFGRKAGWFLCHEGGRLAILEDVQNEDMFWESYRITIPTDVTSSPSVADPGFWESEFRRTETWFENRHVPLRVRDVIAVMGKDGRIFARGLYIPASVVPRWAWLMRPGWRLFVRK